MEAFVTGFFIGLVLTAVVAWLEDWRWRRWFYDIGHERWFDKPHNHRLKALLDELDRAKSLRKGI